MRCTRKSTSKPSSADRAGAKGEKAIELLLINPNTSAHITDRMLQAARDVAGEGVRVHGATARFGPAVIGSRAEQAIASHAAIDLAAVHASGMDAVVLGVSLDCGLHALRELLDVPVCAMTESALLTACMLGQRVGLLTLGERMLPLYQELAAAYGIERRVCGWRALELPAAFVGSQVVAEAAEAIADAVDGLVRSDGCEVVVLAGAVLAGYAAVLRERAEVPLVDGVAAATLQAISLARLGCRAPASGSFAKPRERASSGLSAPLRSLLSGT